MNSREIKVVFYGRNPVGNGRYVIDEVSMQGMLDALALELSGFQIQLTYADDPDISMDIKGYADLLNSVRLRSPKDNIYNLCLGHVIGKSVNLDIVEDVRRGVNRVAFAPETVEPEGSSKIVCHNCGCGC